jgi:hypothetical protein
VTEELTSSHRVPSSAEVVSAITGRELRLASKRSLVRVLFVLSLVPVIVFALILIIGVATEATFGAELRWDPVERFLAVQTFPVLLLALGLGTPIVASDRAEDVLFLYATRPVRPGDYALGKLLAVAGPCMALLFVPGTVMAGLRLGILTHVGPTDTLLVVGKVALASLAIGCGYAGLTVGASALTHRTRWALLGALSVLIFPDTAAGVARLHFAIGPMQAVTDVLKALFAAGTTRSGIWGAALLVGLGAAGTALLLWRARREMTP